MRPTELRGVAFTFAIHVFMYEMKLLCVRLTTLAALYARIPTGLKVAEKSYLALLLDLLKV